MTVRVHGRHAFAELLRQIARDIEGGQVTRPPTINVVGVGDGWEAHVQITYASGDGDATIVDNADDETDPTRASRLWVHDIGGPSDPTDE